jgi:hypothetical protein
MVGEPKVLSTGESSSSALNSSGWVPANSTSSYRVTNHSRTAGM